MRPTTLALVCLAALVTALGPAGDAAASISTVLNNEAGFNASAAANLDLVGVEDFEDNLLSDGQSQTFSSGFGVPTEVSDQTMGGLFPNGLSVPVTIGSNVGLRVTRNFGDVVGTVLGNSTPNTALLLTFDPADRIQAVGFNLVAPFLQATQAARLDLSATLADGTFLSSFTFSPIDAAGSAHVGFLTDPGDAPIELIRLSLAEINGTLRRTNNGLDNLTLFSAPIPEPTSVLCWGGIAVAATALSKRRRPVR